MNSIGMLAELLTPACIWNSFRSSHKKHLVLTGGRKTGKTTLLNKLFRKQTRGITTWAVPKECVFIRENGTDRIERVGIYDGAYGGKENKMRLCQEGFLGMGISALRSCMESEEEWITVDEIGYLETECPEYCEAILRLMEKKKFYRLQSSDICKTVCKKENVLLRLNNNY